MILKDQMGRTVEIEKPVRRIVSLVPSQTEYLYHLGLDQEVVGLTKFCIHPEKWWREKKRVGGTKNADFDKVKALAPDLIIGNKEENDQKNMAVLSQIAPVWMSDVKNLKDALEMMLQLGDIAEKSQESIKIVAEIKRKFNDLSPIHPSKKAVYFIWRNPWMVAGKDTFISDMMTLCGFQNAIQLNRYPILDDEWPKQVDYVFLSSEPYPFKEKDVLDLQEIFPAAKIMLVDGEMFSWYGARLLASPNYFQQLITSIG